MFNFHSWLGIQLSFIFLIVCLSGTLAVFSHEFDWLFNKSARFHGNPEVQFSRNEILKSIKKIYPDSWVTYWANPNEPYLNDIVYLTDGQHTKYLFVNPSTGKIEGESNITVQRFLRDFHYYLFYPVEQIGNYIVLGFGFIFFLIVLSSLIFYKKWYQHFFSLRKLKKIKDIYRYIHRGFGVWCLPLSIILILTGIWYFIERSDFPKISHHLKVDLPKVIPTNSSFENAFVSDKIDLDFCIQLAQNKIPNLQIGNITLPKKNNGAIMITGKSKVPLVRNRANRVYINPNNYEVIKVQKAEEINNITYLNDIADPLHFGNFYGLISKAVWFIFGLGICLSTISGVRIAIKRLKLQKSLPLMIFNWIFFLTLTVVMFGMMTVQYQFEFKNYLWVSLFWLSFFLIIFKVFHFKKPEVK